jgi:hypothetical protein
MFVMAANKMACTSHSAWCDKGGRGHALHRRFVQWDDERSSTTPFLLPWSLNNAQNAVATTHKVGEWSKFSSNRIEWWGNHLCASKVVIHLLRHILNSDRGNFHRFSWFLNVFDLRTAQVRGSGKYLIRTQGQVRYSAKSVQLELWTLT